MVIPSHAYPPALKTVLKAGPILIVSTFFGVLTPMLMYNILYHPHERIEKYHFRSSKFERHVRSRDDISRLYYKEAINW
jgi:hypothetical protein